MTHLTLPAGIDITGEINPDFVSILTPEALTLVIKLHRTFEPRRQELLAQRTARARLIEQGVRPDFLPKTAEIRVESDRQKQTHFCQDPSSARSLKRRKSEIVVKPAGGISPATVG